MQYTAHGPWIHLRLCGTLGIIGIFGSLCFGLVVVLMPCFSQNSSVLEIPLCPEW